jgi:hypothetical protein
MAVWMEGCSLPRINTIKISYQNAQYIRGYALDQRNVWDGHHLNGLVCRMNSSLHSDIFVERWRYERDIGTGPQR